MAFDGNGTYNRVYNWGQDALNNIDITASRVDAEDDGFAAGLSLCVTRDGQGKPASHFIPATGAIYDLGSPSTPWRTIYAATINGNIVSTGVSYAQTSVEASVSVTPANVQYVPLDPRRYSSVSNWSLVYNAVSSLPNSYDNWYRSDHAQHPSLTNAIVGYKSFDDSLLTGTVGWHCTAFGAQALQSNGQSVSAGGTNTAFGYASLEHMVDGSGNTCVGPETFNVLTGLANSHNCAFGYRVGSLATTAVQNNLFGFQVATNMLSGQNNHGYGESVLVNMTYGDGNHCFGYQAGWTQLVGDYTHAFGYQALFNQTAAVITGISVAASAVVTISTVSTTNPFSVGGLVSFKNVTGMTQINGLTGVVTAVGGSSGAWTVTVGINSSGFSAYSSGGNIYPLGNTVFGYQAGLHVFMSSGNVIMGWQAASQNPLDSNNVVLGYQAGFAMSVGATLNVALGYQSMVNALSANSCVAIGQQSGTNVTTATDLVAIGPNSANGVSTALRNTMVGSTTGVNLNGNNNTAYGYNAGSQGSAQTYANTASFGANAVPTASNQITLGDSGITALRCQVTSITSLSDKRFKQNIQPLEVPDEFLDEVQICTFDWLDPSMPSGKQVGVIAQQLDALQIKYGVEWLGLVDKSNPDRWEATPGKLLFLLIQRTQKQELRLRQIERFLQLR